MGYNDFIFTVFFSDWNAFYIICASNVDFLRKISLQIGPNNLKSIHFILKRVVYVPKMCKVQTEVFEHEVPHGATEFSFFLSNWNGYDANCGNICWFLDRDRIEQIN